MRSWRANTHKVGVKQWKSFSNINCSLLAHVTYLMYVSQDSKTARVTCSNQHMPGTFQVLTYWVKQQVQGEEQHEYISNFHCSGSWEWETFCSCQRQYQLYTDLKAHSMYIHYVYYWRNTLYMQSWMSSQIPKDLINPPPAHILFVQMWNYRNAGQAMKPIFTNSHCDNVQMDEQYKPHLQKWH